MAISEIRQDMLEFVSDKDMWHLHIVNPTKKSAPPPPPHT